MTLKEYIENSNFKDKADTLILDDERGLVVLPDNNGRSVCVYFMALDDDEKKIRIFKKFILEKNDFGFIYDGYMASSKIIGIKDCEETILFNYRINELVVARHTLTKAFNLVSEAYKDNDTNFNMIPFKKDLEDKDGRYLIGEIDISYKFPENEFGLCDEANTIKLFVKIYYEANDEEKVPLTLYTSLDDLFNVSNGMGEYITESENLRSTDPEKNPLVYFKKVCEEEIFENIQNTQALIDDLRFKVRSGSISTTPEEYMGKIKLILK